MARKEIEIWKPIPENTNYECSNFGHFRRINKDKRCDKYRYFKGVISGRGYIQLSIPNLSTQLAHRVIASIFIPNPQNKPQINHIDRNRINNHVSNLEWTTQKENVMHSLSLGSYKGNNGRIVLDIKDLKFYKSIREASEETGIPYGTLEFKLRGDNVYKNLKQIRPKSL